MPVPVRLSILKGMLALIMIATLASTWPLWLADRYYPLFPGLDGLFPVHLVISYVIPSLLIISLVFILLLRKPRFFIFLSLALCTVLLVLDTGRIQYWFYFYMLLLIVLLGYNWRVDNITHYSSSLNAVKILLALVYVTVALQHFMPGFIESQWPAFIKPFERFWTPEQCSYLLKVAYAVPVIELFIAGGLFFSSTRVAAISFSALFHIFSVVVLCLQPQTQPAIILWHLFMILLVILAFAGTTGAQKNYGFSLGLYPGFAILLFGLLLPGYFFMNNRHMQNRIELMQSNNAAQYIYLAEADKNKLPLYVQSFALQKEKEYYKLCITSWALHETKIKQVLGPHYLLKLSVQLSRTYGAEALVVMPVEEKQNGALALK